MREEVPERTTHVLNMQCHGHFDRNAQHRSRCLPAVISATQRIPFPEQLGYSLYAKVISIATMPCRRLQSWLFFSCPHLSF
ncbi:hypothetical protein OESDEN_02927 [Oesophagostomum dentatum]|uniref:Uncharacterized protein n=1 Tax=Oesophagostomum dentatum TaxID=61180 RepID=A0A0B1TMR1_OESDE|nr:hypothetical protein OESDEN_02927 [Oesophagostomum dentatum]